MVRLSIKCSSSVDMLRPKIAQFERSVAFNCRLYFANGRLWYTKPDDAIGYAMHNSRSHDAVIRVYDASGNVIETHQPRWQIPHVLRSAREYPLRRRSRAEI